MSTIWHNPDCGTSRNVLAILRAAGEAPEVIEYRKTGWSEAVLRHLFRASGVTPAQALRVKGTEADALGLTAPDISDEALIAAMVADPILVNRPFVTTLKGSALCRPSISVAPLLERLPEAPVLAPDGQVIFDPAAFSGEP